MLSAFIKNLFHIGITTENNASVQNAVNDNAYQGFKDCVDRILASGEEFNYEGTICLLIDKLATDSEINLHNEFAYRALVYLASKKVKSANDTNWDVIIDHVGETRIRSNTTFTGYTHLGLNKELVKEIINLLVREYGFGINTQNKEGVTLFMYTVNSRLMDKEMLEYMVAIGSDVNKLSEVYGRPIHFINKNDFNSYHKFTYLVNLGANPTERIVYKAFDNKGIDFVEHTYYQGLKDYLSDEREFDLESSENNIAEMVRFLDRVELKDVNLNVLLAANHYIETERLKQVRLAI